MINCILIILVNIQSFISDSYVTSKSTMHVKNINVWIFSRYFPAPVNLFDNKLYRYKLVITSSFSSYYFLRLTTTDR